jgi:hypothetical protein
VCLPALDLRLRPLAGEVLELGGPTRLDVTLGRRGDNAGGDRMGGLALEPRGQAQDVVIAAAVEGHDVAHPEAALGEGAGLVEDDGLQAPGALEGGAIRISSQW